MSRINISENENAWEKKSWINNFVNDKEVIANLTEEYAHDILEAVGEDYFSSLDSAIADLSLRTGLTASEVNEVKRVCIAMVQKQAEVPACSIPACAIPGNKEDEEKSGEGAGLIKESPKEAAVAKVSLKEKIAKGMNPGFRKYLDEQKAKKEGKEPKEEGKTEEKKDKEAEASASANKTAWFQGADEASFEGTITSNDPNKLGGPGKMEYPKAPMATTAPGGQDTRPYEQKTFEETAKETKKVMGPNGSEFKLKVEMQRIPEGEKAANASAKRLALIKEITASGKK